MCGYSSTRLGAINWMVATVLAGFAGILITPISGLNPTSFTLFIVPALGAALLGRMTSFSATVVAGLAIGMLQSLMTKLVLQYDWLPTSGLQEGLPFLAIIVALVVFGRSIPWRGTLIDRAMPVAGRPKHVVLSAVLCLAAGTIALFTLGSTLRLGLIQSLIMIVLGLSLVVVTGFAGQISLAQMAFAGFGGFMFGILSGDLSVPFPLALLLAGLATAPLALVVGLPALRTRGIHLAVLTLAAAVALDAFLFSSGTFTGGANGRLDPRGQAVRHRLQHPQLGCDGIPAARVRTARAGGRGARGRAGGVPAQQRHRPPDARDPGERTGGGRLRRQPQPEPSSSRSRPRGSSPGSPDR